MDNGYRDNGFESLSNEDNKNKSRIWSVSALILAVLSIALSFIPAVGITLGALGIAACIISRLRLGYFDKFSIAALICSIFGIVFGGAFIVYNLIY